MKHRIKIGLVGVNFGRGIADELSRPGTANDHFELAAVCDTDVARADAVAAKAGVRVLYHLDELLADPTIQAIGLFTGPGGRAELIQKIIRAGKDVMTTKPFELDPRKAFDVLQEARVLKRVIHLNSPAPLLTADLRQVHRWREAFELGAPVAFRAEAWAPYREKADGSWYDDPRKCPAAPIFRIGIYLINDMVRLLGAPESVYAMHSRIFTERPTPDNAQLAIRFQNGVLANVFASFCIDDTELYANSFTLNFQNGTIYRNVGRPVFGLDRKITQLGLIMGDGRIEKAESPEVSGDYQWEAFARAILGEKLEDATSAEEIVAGVRIVAAMARSERSGRAELV